MYSFIEDQIILANEHHYIKYLLTEFHKDNCRELFYKYAIFLIRILSLKI